MSPSGGGFIDFTSTAGMAAAHSGAYKGFAYSFILVLSRDAHWNQAASVPLQLTSGAVALRNYCNHARDGTVHAWRRSAMQRF